MLFWSIYTDMLLWYDVVYPILSFFPHYDGCILSYKLSSFITFLTILLVNSTPQNMIYKFQIDIFFFLF